MPGVVHYIPIITTVIALSLAFSLGRRFRARGGALKSAMQFWRRQEMRARAEGNLLIAMAALLPGIGGSFPRFGYTEVYVTEFVGIVLIYLGYRRATRDAVPMEAVSHDVPLSPASAR